MTTKTAKKIKKDIPGMKGEAALYQLSTPHSGHEFVVVSAVSVFGEPETYIFPADESGEVLGWAQLEGSFRGDLDHAQALENAGYELV